ncbi:hypothetical protein BGZ65_012210, partial [Modicella reniformis]
TQRLIGVDGEVHQRFRNKLDSIVKTDSDKLVSELEKTRVRLAQKNLYLKTRDNDHLVQLYENRVDQDIEFVGWFKDVFGGSIKPCRMGLPPQQYDIQDVNVTQKSMSTFNESGGKGHKHWSVEFKRDRRHSAYYYAVVSTTNRIKYREEMNEARSDIVEYEKTEQNLSEICALHDQEKSKIGSYHKILELTKAEILPVKEFLELANAGIYQGTDVNCQAKALEKHLMEKFGL